MSGKKYYWLKLKKDFFKRHDIQVIETMDMGRNFIGFELDKEYFDLANERIQAEQSQIRMF